jgi:CDP-diacylglycerol pyrophosphatase
MVRAPNAPNYFANAWEVRNHIDEALHLALPRDDVGLAINSVASRSQDQLHIHFSCIRTDVWEALHNSESKIGDRWTPFAAPLYGRYYMAVWVHSEHLGANNPFRLLAERLPDAAQNMGDRTLVVVGFTRSNGAKGFVIFTDRVNKDAGDLANGEELLDHSCQIAAEGKGSPAGPLESRTE